MFPSSTPRSRDRVLADVRDDLTAAHSAFYPAVTSAVSQFVAHTLDSALEVFGCACLGVSSATHDSMSSIASLGIVLFIAILRLYVAWCQSI